MCTNFQTKQTTLNIWAQICLKLDFGVEIPKTKSGFGITILEICAPILKQNKQLQILGPNLPKNGCWGWNFKNLILDSESAPPLYRVLTFSQNGQHLVFRPKFGEIAQLCAIFWFKYCWGCCRELGLGWTEQGGGGWKWVHSLVIPFDDIFKNLSLVVSYTPVMLHSQWHYGSSSLHKGYPWYNVPSHTISTSWDGRGWARVYTPPIPYFPYPMYAHV